MLTIIFTFSLFSVAAIVIWKMMEEKKSKKFFFSDLRKRADEVVEKTINGAKNRFSVLNKKNGKLIAVFAGNSILNGISSVKRKTYLKKLKFLDSLRAGGNLKKKGSASFFLKNVSEYKGKYTK